MAAAREYFSVICTGMGYYIDMKTNHANSGPPLASYYQNLKEVLQKNIEKVIRGKEDVIEYLMIALISGGHVLIEDVPGVGKTTMVSALAKSLDMRFTRIQFTPDLMPSDITGFNLYNPREQQFVFHEGLVMSHIILADEINRSAPRTQSSLLEVMQEYQVTVDGVSYPVPEPFLVLATQNPIEFAGTYPLPEAQLDRFMLKVDMGYPSREDEIAILDQDTRGLLSEAIEPVAGIQDILWLRDRLQHAYISYAIRQYIVDLCRKTRDHPRLAIGASPRAAQMLLRAASVRALLRGREYVLPDDIIELSVPVLGHRLTVSQESLFQGARTDTILKEILAGLPVPKV